MTRGWLAQGKSQHGTDEQRRADRDHRPVHASNHRRVIGAPELNSVFSEERFPTRTDQVRGGTRIRVREVTGAHPTVTSGRGTYAAHVAVTEGGGQSSRCGCRGNRVSPVWGYQSQCVTGIDLNESCPRHGRRHEHVSYGDLIIAKLQRREPQSCPGQPGDQDDQWQKFAGVTKSCCDDGDTGASAEQPDRRRKSAIETRVEHVPIVAGGGH